MNERLRELIAKPSCDKTLSEFYEIIELLDNAGYIRTAASYKKQLEMHKKRLVNERRSKEADTFTASLPPVINDDIWGGK